MLAANLAVTIISNISGYIGDILSQKLNTLLSQSYYDHILKLPLEYYDNEVAGRITSRLERSIVTISNLVNAFANNFIGFFLTAAFTLIVMAFYSVPIALLMAGLFPFYIWLTSLSSKAWQAKQQAINQDIDYANGRFIESINQIRVVKSFVQELIESKIFSDKRASIEDKTKVQSVEWHKYDVLRRVGLNIIFLLVYGLIALQAFSGHFGPLTQAIGTMTLLFQLATQAQFPLFGSSFIVEQLQRAQAGSKDFFEVMETVPKIQDISDAHDLVISAGHIKYQNVTFAYGGGQNVLDDISFEVEQGTKVALVGESGQGKTTIANLLLRFYEPTSGEILLDGRNISKVSQASLRRHIGVVFQEPALFSGSVRENISYGSPHATQKQIEAAANAANAAKFIEALPNGYDTEIGERGVKLSGGQKQRLAIARAILKDPPILILDEATSSLDSKAEHEVQDALEVLMSGRTTIIIAHRLSTIANVDLIVGLQNGKISEIGSPQQLAKGQGIYSELLKLQQTPPSKARQAKLKKFDLAK
jgi:ATP-binding cassette, subfamily B, bacterial